MRNDKGQFKKGLTPWNKGTKGVMKPNVGNFKKGLTPWNKGQRSLTHHSQEHKDKISRSRMGHEVSHETRLKMSARKKEKFLKFGFINTPETRTKVSATLTGRQNPQHSAFMKGKRYAYIDDRTTLSERKERNSPACKNWRTSVYRRDGFKCRIADGHCSGKIEAHHILGWRDYPELRYQSNNGITLCLHHHPRSRFGEMILSPFFQEMVTEAN
jgi:hypothetical protein